MALFAGWLLTLITQVLTALGVSFSRKLAIGAAAVAAMLICLGVFVTAIGGLLNGIAAGAPEWIVQGMCFIPSNAPACLGAYFSARVARFVYDFHMDAIKTLAEIN
ncbi:DUF5455 family protein [Silvimonas amylolytica]|uniref:Uncharacterized protein n=1 Tax=Silvimonas amylolytica TaxID=449663 RepID=A0ABQ2PSA7_9NEIS|nr:DUF5455 family protein [Silvimonas amylolytica]GGP24428.1 hypothetical protein GCM10010971_02470 [Silvimonas amylolytica]GGP28337.1 hypothetical protein GCM10010971_41560 [Silvimonas amylolytica]